MIRVYLDRLQPAQAERTLELVREHFGDTRFAWRGGHDDVCVFYYRIHSPVLLVEYDNHPGIFRANPEPARYHVHTIVRHPHGNDCERDLLAQHYRLHHSERATGRPPQGSLTCGVLGRPLAFTVTGGHTDDVLSSVPFGFLSDVYARVSGVATEAR
ncbi:DUF3500 domain-containing protein [Streptomyces sp. FR-108]|uniref:DUF3500 domain-containing protein n=1 Tax=Streptomyces sp. FR-108 TaxID=3416665 RepID=UPI003CF59E9F